MAVMLRRRRIWVLLERLLAAQLVVLILLTDPFQTGAADPHGYSRGLGGVDAAHLLGECGVRDPGCRLGRRDFLHHLVDLLERQALHLGDEEVGKQERHDAKGSPDEEHFWS